MKKMITIAFLASLGTCAFAAAPTSGANKSAQTANSLSTAWKSYRTLQPKDHKNDIEMVYGGEDIKNPAVIQTAQS